VQSAVEAALRRRYRHHDWSPAVLGGFTDAAVWRLDGRHSLYVKYIAEPDPADPGASPLAEAERLRWLRAQQVPCPEPVDAGTIDEYEYLVTEAAPGLTAAQSWPAGSRMAVVDAVADFVRQLHTLPVTDCPFDRRLKVRLPLAQEVAGLGLVDLKALDAKRRGWSINQLVTELIATARQVGREEPVVCHGDYCLPNVLVDPDSRQVSAIIDVGRLGVADRYTDLALMTRSLASVTLNPQYGRRFADRFLYRYGEIPADPDRIALYRLLDEFS
jgi:kanamycin kinase